MKAWTRGLALLLTVTMVSTAVPSTAIASNTDYGTEDVVSQETENKERSQDNGEETEKAKREQDDKEQTKTEEEEREQANSKQTKEEEPNQGSKEQTKEEELSQNTSKDTNKNEGLEAKELNQDTTIQIEDKNFYKDSNNSMPMPREVIQEYRTLTVGQELHQTDGNRENYLFSPEESGYYRLSCESSNEQKFDFNYWKTIYYTKDENGNDVQHNYTDYYNSITDTYAERLIWLNQEEEYMFYCSAEQGYGPYDFKIKIDKVEISSIEVSQAPTEDSYNYLDFTGMKVKLNYTNQTSSISGVYNTCSIDVLRWSNIAYQQLGQIEGPYIIAIDNEEKWSSDCSKLSEGTHTATLRIHEYTKENDDYQENNYDFPVNFVIKRGNIKSLKVEDATVNYTQDFCEELGSVKLLVSYNDGTKDKTISSYNQEVSQYLKYSVKTEEGTEEEYRTTNIDTYLENGGAIGTATVYVSYRGGETSYQINIAENPYESMEIIPKRTIYYTGCGYNFGESSYSGDYLSMGDIGVILTRKDGTQENYSNYYELPGYWYRNGRFGLKLKNNEDNDYYYEIIDDFISAGGITGTQEVEVSYCKMKASYQITIQENPYDHIKIETAPGKLQYVHNQKNNLSLDGLVIYAYKDANETESNYDVYNYNDYSDFGNDSGTMTEEQFYRMNRFFSTFLGGHESVEYLELGEHTVSIFFMGHQAEYTIEVVEKLAESLKILQTPEKLSYYANYDSGISFYGLIIEIEDLQGNTKKYKYNYTPSEEESDFGNWWDLNNDFDYSYDINWDKTGTYTITLSYLGAKNTFKVEIVELPVESIEITKMPEKKSYYRYESHDIDLSGMEYQVTYKDNTIYYGTAEGSDAYFIYGEEQFYLSSRWYSRNASGLANLGDNAIVISAGAGKDTVTDTIIVKENPVTSIEMLKEPEKLYYLSREQSIDLYGMELQIAYVDGTTEKITFTEHVSKWEVSNTYGGTITAYKGSNEIKIQYRNGGYVLELPPMDFSKLNPIEMTEEGNYHTVLTEEKPYEIYTFTPSETKTYHFFSDGNDDNFVELYKGTQCIESNDDGENSNFCLSYDLKANTTYYYVVSEYSFGNAGTFDCYFSSVTDSLSDLTVEDFNIVQTPKREWYDFESGNIWAENTNLYGTIYEILYSNGWKKTTQVDYYNSSTTINGTVLSVKWKYTTRDEYGEGYVEKRADNALVYTYGEKVMEFPAAFDVPTPVTSLEIVKNPWKDKKIYEYQCACQDFNMEGLTVKIHYNDGRESETVTWEDWGNSQYYNGYYMQFTWDTIESGKENNFILSYMGKTAEIPFMVLENPVKSIKILQQPEKQEYYSFEETMDLYGIKLQITYKDNSVQTAEANTHGTSLEVQGAYPERLTTSLGYIYDDETYNEKPIWNLYYMGYKQEIMPYKTETIYARKCSSFNRGEREANYFDGYHPLSDFRFFSL